MRRLPDPQSEGRNDEPKAVVGDHQIPGQNDGNQLRMTGRGAPGKWGGQTAGETVTHKTTHTAGDRVLAIGESS